MKTTNSISHVKVFAGGSYWEVEITRSDGNTRLYPDQPFWAMTLLMMLRQAGYLVVASGINGMGGHYVWTCRL